MGGTLYTGFVPQENLTNPGISRGVLRLFPGFFFFTISLYWLSYKMPMELLAKHICTVNVSYLFLFSTRLISRNSLKNPGLYSKKKNSRTFENENKNPGFFRRHTNPVYSFLICNIKCTLFALE